MGGGGFMQLFLLVLQLLLFLKGFSESERNKLAMLTGILLANGTLNASILNSLYNENLVKEGKGGPAPPLGRGDRTMTSRWKLWWQYILMSFLWC